jgi:hypothetical protein
LLWPRICPDRWAARSRSLVASSHGLSDDGDYDAIFEVYRGRMAEWITWEKASRAAG